MAFVREAVLPTGNFFFIPCKSKKRLFAYGKPYAKSLIQHHCRISPGLLRNRTDETYDMCKHMQLLPFCSFLLCVCILYFIQKNPLVNYFFDFRKIRLPFTIWFSQDSLGIYFFVSAKSACHLPFDSRKIR